MDTMCETNDHLFCRSLVGQKQKLNIENTNVTERQEPAFNDPLELPGKIFFVSLDFEKWGLPDGHNV